MMKSNHEPPMNNKISLADIRAFVVIANAGSFTAAAELLGCSRSHLSKQLSQLEADLGVKLISRTTRTQRLTLQGKAFYERCHSSLNGIDLAIEDAIDSANTIKGKIRVNCVGGHIGEEIIAPLIGEYLQQYPEVSIDLDFSSRRVDLVSGEFDLVFRMGQLEDSNLIAQKLADIRISTLATPEYLQQQGSPEHPKALADHRCITGSISHWGFVRCDDPSHHAEVVVDGPLKCKNGRAMLASALAGNGIVRLPALYCQEEIASGQLVPVFKQWTIPDTPLYLVYLQDKHQPERLKSFIQFVQRNIGHYTAQD